MCCKVCDEITYAVPNFYGGTVDIMEAMSDKNYNWREWDVFAKEIRTHSIRATRKFHLNAQDFCQGTTVEGKFNFWS